MNEKLSNIKKVQIDFSSIFKAVLVLVVLYALFLVRDVLLIIVTAVVIASAVEPATRWFVERRVPRTVAVVMIYLAVFSVLLGVVFLFVPTFINEASNLLQNIPSEVGSLQISNIFSDSSIVRNLPLGQEASLSEYLRELQTSIATYSEGIFSALAGIFGGVMSFVLIVVISFYLAVQRNGIEDFIGVVVPFRHQGYAINLWRRTQAKIGKWLQGQLLLMLIIGVLTYVGLVLLGVPNAFVFAVIAGFFEIIPIFGPILAAIPAIAVGWADGGVTFALMIAGLYVIIQQLENHLIYPQVVNKVVGIPALVVLISLLIGAKLAGFLGVILSVPIATLVMEFTHDIQRRNKQLAEIKEKESHAG